MIYVCYICKILRVSPQYSRSNCSRECDIIWYMYNDIEHLFAQPIKKATGHMGLGRNCGAAVEYLNLDCYISRPASSSFHWQWKTCKRAEFAGVGTGLKKGQQKQERLHHDGVLWGLNLLSCSFFLNWWIYFDWWLKLFEIERIAYLLLQVWFCFLELIRITYKLKPQSPPLTVCCYVVDVLLWVCSWKKLMDNFISSIKFFFRWWDLETIKCVCVVCALFRMLLKIIQCVDL